jgi:cysteinyl-tRNA synthetase
MLKIYNSLSRKVEEFKPINPPHVGMYTCGPTVYDFAHIGNFRTYTTADLLLRVLKYNRYEVKYVMNLTDVGHLTGDNLGDADTGDDRMEKAAKKEGKTAWDIAKFYTAAFVKDFDLLNLEKPTRLVKATDHIQEQIELVKRLEEKGFTYQTSDGIYFDTSRFKDYGALSDLDQVKEGARVEINEEKKNPRDFALWKFSPTEKAAASKRQMEWKSPWGKGFPGWHIECSAMSMKYLGESFDIHAGGIDLKQTHHPNEIAQSEAATGKKFVNFWVHGAFMLVQGERMSKSLGNNYKLYDLEKEGHTPLGLRYLYLQAHYRQEMNFTFASLQAAENALKKLYEEAAKWDEPTSGCEDFEQRFLEAINDDLNMSKALAVVWEMIKSDNPSGAKAGCLFKMDEVLGFDIKKISLHLKREQGVIPGDIRKLVQERQELRKQRQFNAADQIRAQIEKMGYEIEDSEKGIKVKKIY